MFKLDQQLGAQESQEEFGPPVPTTAQNITQYATDITGLQKNIIYAVGAGIVAYMVYQYMTSEG